MTSRFVVPFYLHVLHGNVVHTYRSGERAKLLEQMRAVAASVRFEDALQLWPRGWRESLMASWWSAVWQWPGATSHVEPLLIPSRSCFEGQAHCLALLRVNSPQSRAVLVRYLDEYLPRYDLEYDQPWAMAAFTLACADAAEPVPGRIHEAWRQWSSRAKGSDLDAYLGTVKGLSALADAVAAPLLRIPLLGDAISG